MATSRFEEYTIEPAPSEEEATAIAAAIASHLDALERASIEAHESEEAIHRWPMASRGRDLARARDGAPKNAWRRVGRYEQLR